MTILIKMIILSIADILLLFAIIGLAAFTMYLVESYENNGNVTVIIS